MGPVFEVSPDTTVFRMRPTGAAVHAPLGRLPIQPGSESDCVPVLGEPVAFTLNGPIPGSDAPAMTFPVYPLPSGLELLPVSRSVQTVLASGVSSQQDRWSSAVPRTCDVSQEGPFDAYCAPMDTGDTGLPGCPYRIMSYTGPAAADTNPAFGIQLHYPRFWSLSGRRSLLGCCTILRPFGLRIWIRRMLWRPRDAGLMLSNLQILSLFVTSLQRMSTVLGNGNGFVSGGAGALGGTVYVRDGAMAPSDGSG